MRHLHQAVVIAFGLLLPTAAVADTVTAAVGEYRPFTGEALDNGGLAVELVRTAFASANIELDLVWAPWARASRMVEQQDADFSFPFIRTEERSAKFAFSDSMFEPRVRLFRTVQPASGPQTIDELRGLSVCSPAGYALPPSLTQKTDLFLLVSPSSMGRCFKRLAAARVDFVVANEIEGPAEAMAALQPPGRIEATGPVLETSENRLIFALDHPRRDELIFAFNTGIAALRADGRFEEIVERHIGWLRGFADIGELDALPPSTN